MERQEGTYFEASRGSAGVEPNRQEFIQDGSIGLDTPTQRYEGEAI